MNKKDEVMVMSLAPSVFKERHYICAIRVQVFFFSSPNIIASLPPYGERQGICASNMSGVINFLEGDYVFFTLTLRQFAAAQLPAY